MELMRLYVGICICGGVVLLLLGLIAGSHGGTLRRKGFFLIALAFAPAVFIGLLRAGGASLGTAARENPLGLLLVVALVSGAAYAALKARASKRDAPPRLRLKRPYTHKSTPDFFSIIREQLGSRDE